VHALQLGEPDFATPDFITESMRLALEDGRTHYAPPLGDPDLRRALADSVSVRSATSYDASQVVVTAGGTGAINAAVHALVDPGDKVVIPEPTYSLYADAVVMAGGTPTFVPAASNLRLDLDAIEQTCRDARLLVLCNPCNPTGTVTSASELERLSRICRRHDVLLLADEAYDHIVFEEGAFRSTLEVEGLSGRLVYCQTFSKTYAMTGWRIGYVVAPPDVVDAIAVAHRTFNGAVNSAVQRAALAASVSDGGWPAARLEDYRRRRDLVVDALGRIPGLELVPPEGTFYAFPRFDHDVTSDEMTAMCLSHGVAVRSGREFGVSGEKHLRVAFCVDDEELANGLRCLVGAFGLL
jgi:aspartate aminotransferase